MKPKQIPQSGGISDFLMQHAGGRPGGNPVHIANKQSAPGSVHSGVVPASTQRLQPLRQALVQHVGSENWPEAGRSAEAILELAPQDATALQILGVSRFHAGDPAAAIEHIEKALAIEPNQVEARHNLARILDQSGNFDAANGHFSQILTARPDYLPAQLDFANCLRRQGRLHDALQQYEQIVARDAQNVAAAVNAATLQGEIGQHEVAERRLTDLTERFPSYAPAHNNLGDLLKAAGRNRAALRHYRQAARLDPNDALYAANVREVQYRSIPAWHLPMLMDEGRNDAFERAIKNALEETGSQARVLDIGTGSGLLAMMAARAGAAAVVGCEMIPALSNVAEEIVSANGFDNQITILPRKSTDLRVPKDMPEPADIVVAELLDCSLLGEGILPTLRHAARELAQPGARILPIRAVLSGMLVSAPELRRVNPIRNISGFDLSAFDQFRNPAAFQKFEMAHQPHVPLSNCSEVYTLSFTDVPPDRTTQEVSIPIKRMGQLDAIIVWFDLYITDTVVLTTRPQHLVDEPKSENEQELFYSDHWGQAIMFFPAPREVLEGSVVNIEVGHTDHRLLINLAP